MCIGLRGLVGLRAIQNLLEQMLSTSDIDTFLVFAFDANVDTTMDGLSFH